MNYCTRALESPLTSNLSKGKIRLLFGARQTGKSTLLKKILGDKTVVIDLQDSEQRLEYERRPKALTERLLALTGRQTVLIDEIQRVPALLDEIQWLYDKREARFEFYLTGSSARKLRVSSSNLLPGRSHLFNLAPVLQAERGQKSKVLSLMVKEKKNFFPKRRLNELLLYGSLPGIQDEKPATAAKTLESYVELYLEEEIRKEALVKDIGAFSRFLEWAALESGRIMNLTNLSNQSGVPIATLRIFYQVLVDTFIGYWLDPYKGSGRKRLLTTPKFFFFDMGVRNAGARLDLTENLIRLQGGDLLEQWVGLELLGRTQFLGRGYRVGFWKTVGGAEVDFILQTPKEIIPIEVKWTERPNKTDAQHIMRFLQDEPRAKKGFVVCRVKETRQLTERVQAINWTDL